MSAIVSSQEHSSSINPDVCQNSRGSGKRWFVCFAFVALTIAVATLAYRQQQPWVEIVGKDVLRTTAPSQTIASARDAVIQKRQNWIVGEDGKRSDPSYQGAARTWTSGFSPKNIRVKIARGKTQITDRNDATLSIESISVTDTPTLVFIEHDTSDGKQNVMNELLSELTKKGVKVR